MKTSAFPIITTVVLWQLMNFDTCCPKAWAATESL